MTPSTTITGVGVVGCGVMGAGIAQICALADVDVVVAVSQPGSVPPRRLELETSLGRATSRGTITQAESDAARERMTLTADLADLADRQLVFEAATEDERVKAEILGTLGKILERPDAIIASNTSSIPIMKLGRAAANPDRVLGAHFFNPATRMQLVEVVESLLTDPACTQRVERFITGTLGKTVVRSPDRSGFVVNALLFPYLLSAVRMVEAGFATADDIDTAMVLGCNHPMGPLRLADLVGLDVVQAIGESLHAEFGEPQHAPPALLRRMVDAGLLGKKSGRGFYEYTGGPS